MQIKIAGGRIIDPAQKIDRIDDLYIVKGRIAAVGEEPDGFIADEEYDAEGQIVCPGLIDLFAHLREPGLTQKGTIASETAAAAAGVLPHWWLHQTPNRLWIVRRLQS